MRNLKPSVFRAETRAFCVGVGGIGMSALARWLQHRGVRVTGSDRVDSPIVAELRDEGIPVSIEPTGATLPNEADVLVFSDAVLPEDPARQQASARGVLEIMYADALGVLAEGMTTIAISGSHGKSTTTAMVGIILTAAGKDPTVIVGTRVPQFAGKNFRAGASGLLVVEADEYREHCLRFTPTVGVITSTDHDHVDAFPTLAAYRDVFLRYVDRILPGGTLVVRASDPFTVALTTRAGDRQVTMFDLVGEGMPLDRITLAATMSTRVPGRTQSFEVFLRGTSLGTWEISLPGEHLILDALAALGTVLPLGVEPEIAQRTLSAFAGTWRRFERVGALNGAPVISDYAHHPTELRALLQATRQWYPNRRVVLAFQPHQKIRTRAFAPAFLDALTLPSSDLLILAEVYDVTGREEEGDATTSRAWVPELEKRGGAVVFAETLDAVEGELRARVRPDDVVLVVGAGTIDSVARTFAA